MISRKFFIGAAAIAVATVSAGNAFFSGGNVISAELTSRSVELKGFRAAAYSGMSSPSAFAAFTV
ncbi:MAG: hypothetical protein MJ025_06370 [Victivallaceae bacterium]|nr:hypothetical protein [Victivallaceae bacterium]